MNQEHLVLVLFLPLIIIGIVNSVNAEITNDELGYDDVVIEEITVGDGPYEVAISTQANLAYVNNEDSDTVSIIDLETYKVIESLTVLPGPYGMGVYEDGGKVYVSNEDADFVSVIDIKTSKITEKIAVGNSPHAVKVNSITKKVYVADFGSNTITVLDANNHNGITKIGVGMNPAGIAVNEKTNKIFVANNLSYTVSVIDGSSDKVISTVKVQQGPFGIALNQVTNTVYVANHLSHSISVIDGSNFDIITSIKVGHTPRLIGINEKSNMIYVANEDSGSVSIIDGLTNTLVYTIEEIGSAPWGVTVEPVTNLIYVTGGSDDETVYVLDGNIIENFLKNRKVETKLQDETKIIEESIQTIDDIRPITIEKNEVNVQVSTNAAEPDCALSVSCYEPVSIKIKTGTKVNWRNNDNAVHTVTSGTPEFQGNDFDSKLLKPASTFSYIFKSPGTFDYFCTLHTWMVGRVIVEDSQQRQEIPNWIKNNAKWWSEGQIQDSDFVKGVQYMIKEKIMLIPDLPKSTSPSDQKIPEWIKNNAGWWAQGLISQDDFVNGIKYLVEKSIIQVN